MPGLHAGTSSFGMSGVQCTRHCHGSTSRLQQAAAAGWHSTQLICPGSTTTSGQVMCLLVIHCYSSSSSSRLSGDLGNSSSVALCEFWLPVCDRPGLAWLWDQPGVRAGAATRSRVLGDGNGGSGNNETQHSKQSPGHGTCQRGAGSTMLPARVCHYRRWRGRS